MLLSPHFTLEELTVSQEAVRKNLDNTPSRGVIKSLTLLCDNMLEPIHDLVKSSVIVSSGYRSVLVNEAIGGADNSQHVKGEAADINAKGYTVEALYKLIKKSGLPFDQLIQEFDRWVHVSFSSRNRKMCLRATKNVLGKTMYVVD